MKILFIGFLSVIAASQPLAASTNAAATPTGPIVRAPNPDDPVEKEYRKLMEDDDAAQDEVDQWIKESHASTEKGSGPADFTLRTRINQRLDRVRDAYENFLLRHPNHVHARVAFGSFLSDIGEDENSVAQLERARELDPKDPAIWNNLANHYGHRSPVKKALEYYAKAIELSPEQSVYYQNLATTVFLFRKDAMEFYQLNEQQVFDRSLELYRKALKFDPDNFVLASDYAHTFYGIQPARPGEAIAAWESALRIAKDEDQRQGVQIHLARVKLSAGRFDEARQHLGAVTNEVYAELKSRVARTIEEKSKNPGVSAPAVPTKPVEQPKPSPATSQ